jgi:two-component system, LuxR family, response regulator FixJ
MLDSSRTIHIVDDDDVVRDSLKALLETQDFIVEEFSSGGDFLARRTGAAACLVLDIHMPEMTGIDVLRHLRQAGDRLPVIMVTGKWDAAIRAQADVLGVIAFLDKPVSPARLFSEIRKAISTQSP